MAAAITCTLLVLLAGLLAKGPTGQRSRGPVPPQDQQLTNWLSAHRFHYGPGASWAAGCAKLGQPRPYLPAPGRGRLFAARPAGSVTAGIRRDGIPRRIIIDVSIPVRVRDVVIPPDELSWRFSRSPGPGGQSVNTADSRVELSYNLAGSDALGPVRKERALRALAGRLAGGVVTVSASEHRSQLRNRQAAANRLAALLDAAAAPPPPRRRPTKPSRAARERRLAAKQRRSQVKRMRRFDDD